MHRRTLPILCAAFLLTVIWGTSAPAAAQSLYSTPAEAVNALVVAAKSGEPAALAQILGPGTEELINSGDADGDKADRADFVASWQEKHSLATADDGSVFLIVGKNDRTFPVPIKKNAAGQWYFDGKAGLEELVNRRIGRNEFSAMEVCRAIADAQLEYSRLDPGLAPVPHFAQKIVSTPGQRDGLYWPSKEGEPRSPLGELVASAAAEGYKEPATAYHGYRYRILTAQGAHAPGGAYDYVGKGLMFGGFAVLAYPENYGVSGVMTFVLGHDGALWEKNLGADTTALAGKITLYDPDETWQKVPPEDAD